MPTNKLAAQFTEEDLAGLTDEEKEGLLDASLTDDDTTDVDAADDSVEGQPSDAADGAEDTDADGEDDKPSDDKADQDAAGEGDNSANGDENAPKAGADGAADDAVPAPVVDPVRPRAVKAPDNAATQLEELRKQQDALDEKFDNGDLTAAERRRQDRELQDRIDEIRRQQERAAQSLEDQKSYWFDHTVAGFLAKPEHAMYQPGTMFFDALDTQVKVLQTTTFKDDPFDPQIMAQAHAKILKDLGDSAPETARAKQRTAPDAKNERRIPPRLGDMPAAGEDDLSGDRSTFARLDKLASSNWTAFENELEKLAPAVRDRYLANT